MKLPDLHCDFETRATVDLKKQGVYVYAEHPDTDVWCMSYAFGDGPVQLWKMGEPCPPAVAAHVTAGGMLVAFNAAFERIIWWAILSHRYGWPKPKTEQFRCVMVQCMAMALPASLENAAPALGITAEKDMQGHRLMMQMSKPRKIVDGRPIWWDDDERRGKLHRYCMQDTVVERLVDDRTVPIRESERQLWVLDQKINDRGVKVDVALCKQAQKIVGAAAKAMDRQISEVTLGGVTGVSNHKELSAWLRSRGVPAESVAKDAVVDLLGTDILPSDCRRALEIRQKGAKTSNAKIPALLRCINRDQRARGLLQFNAASTGRWAGRRFQPQNITRPVMENPESAIPAIMTGSYELMAAIYDDVLQVISDCLRSMLRAE